MSAGLQQVLVAAVVALALGYAGHRLWRSVAVARRAKAKGCGPDCGCGH